MFPTAHGVVSQGGRGELPPAGPAYDVALVVADALHATTAQTHSELTSLGHTVTVIEDAQIGSVNWSDYDVLVTCRTNTTTTVGAALRAAIDAHTPAVIGWIPTSPPSNSNVTTILASGRLNFVGGVTRVRSNRPVTVDIIDNTHPITNVFALGNATVLQATGYGAGAREGVTVGNVLAYNPISTGFSDEVSVAAITAGTPDRSSVNIGANVALVDFIGSGQSLTADGLTVVERALQWACGDLP